MSGVMKRLCPVRLEKISRVDEGGEDGGVAYRRLDAKSRILQKFHLRWLDVTSIIGKPEQIKLGAMPSGWQFAYR